jgi:hypothetical protein
MSIKRNLDRRTLEEEHSRQFIETTDYATTNSVKLLRSAERRHTLKQLR